MPHPSPALPPDALVDATSADTYQRALVDVVARVSGWFATIERPFTGATPADLAPGVEAVDLDSPLDSLDAALEEVDRLYLRDAVWFHHPRYMAHLNCPVALPAVAAEAVLAAVNSSLDTWDQSAGGTLIERRVLRWATDRLGLGPDADGVFTSGGTQSNLHALFLAREEARRRHGTGRRMRVLASEHAHFSVAKATALLGLGWDAVIPVPCDRDRRLLPLELGRALAACRDRGEVVMAVVATAGTTDFGSIDPVPAVADLCAATGTWLHADAAYGCGLLVSRRRHLLRGVDRADSVTVDFHKSFFQPVSSSAVLVRDARTLGHATIHADYLNPEDPDGVVPNQVDASLQTTRRFDALKLWLTLRVLGPDGIGALFDAACDLAAAVHDRLVDDPRFRVVVAPTLSTLVLRWEPDVDCPPTRVDAANVAARRAVAAEGLAMLGGTVVDGRSHLKLTLLNPRTTVDEVVEVLDLAAARAASAFGTAHGASRTPTRAS